MKRLALFIVCMLVVMTAFSQSDTTDLNSYINTNFPDNTSGFITPERLRNVSKELMRSSANLLERNYFAEPIEVDDTIKSTVGFFSWDGANWIELGDLSDTAFGRFRSTLGAYVLMNDTLSLGPNKVPFVGSYLTISPTQYFINSIGNYTAVGSDSLIARVGLWGSTGSNLLEIKDSTQASLVSDSAVVLLAQQQISINSMDKLDIASSDQANITVGGTTTVESVGKIVLKSTGGTVEVNPLDNMLINSTAGAFYPPRMTETERDAISPDPGATIYCADCTATDASTGVIQVYNGSAWKNSW